ncbi:carboxylating nicotinate-nucleotide diphosphorylase [Thermodesulfobacterium sp. TA1]|uniref:carboxylating nicotinate-nucleotide diphosphorylase n=1 Tax=Thermodesulfobacterium sp. TA1 TaxID=2234087 RepID=UPI0012321C7D|nr:carboxylating nicotinate-nucleotide diphosphorylase [Thermodesulfobacterium sp. TA1]QER42346.1 carboxylating nicotinate-nucleotide diphosphorylase [Thermodesulfobacterium sp. TA1]
MLEKWKIRNLLVQAFEEDLPFYDLTTELVIKENPVVKAYFLAKEPLVVCGTSVVEEGFAFIDPEIKTLWYYHEGEEVEAYTKIGTVEGKVKSILKAERIVLNLFQHLSGIATYTRKMVKKLSPYKTVLLDTRKTLPGLKVLQKYAVRVGGAQNHRFSLSDGILIKDNHIKVLGGIEKIPQALKKLPHYLKIEIEVKSLEELEFLLKAKAPVDIVLLDNFTPEAIQKAKDLIKAYNPNLKIEVSGGINLDNIEDFAKLEVDYLSAGSLTHSVKAVDISLKIE